MGGEGEPNIQLVRGIPSADAFLSLRPPRLLDTSICGDPPRTPILHHTNDTTITAITAPGTRSCFRLVQPASANRMVVPLCGLDVRGLAIHNGLFREFSIRSLLIS